MLRTSLGRIVLPDGTPAILKYPRNAELPDRPEIPHILGYPRCLKCRKPVSSVKIEDVGTGRLEVRAKCHGQEDVIKVKYEDMHRWRRLAWGLAFAGGKVAAIVTQTQIVIPRSAE